jgi:isoleucyl-tRNA synthetase
MAADQANKPSFKDTLNLPRTDFPMRPQPAVDDPALIERWEKDNLYRKTFDLHKGSELFILHDGPPYANGHIHLGSSYNKMLKDIFAKAQRMMGKQVPVTPGWDCHGLPIELKVTQANPGLSRAELKRACRAYAQEWINTQRKEFKRLGILMDWDRPYVTMAYSYEASILRALAKFVQDGYIERKNKTVPWCFSCQTVLAAAEIEYHDRKDPSIYVFFPLTEKSRNALFPGISGRIGFAVWTTTPWTLPLNRAVVLRPQTHYVLLERNGEYVLVGEALADAFCKIVGMEKKKIGHVSAEDIVRAGATVEHPFIQGRTAPVLADNSVEVLEGTACVHNAPGAGIVDYEIGIKYGLEIYSPVGPDGKYTEGIEPQALVGMSVTDAQGWVIKTLQEKNNLIFKTSLNHSYPHCWRCRNGLIFRATKQWFCDLSKNNLKERVLAGVALLDMIPSGAKHHLASAIGGRLEWCISRQRVWGVPIPALVCTTCDYSILTYEHVCAVAQEVERAGIEYWDTVAVEKYVPKDMKCPSCSGSSFVKEQDILDVWFESGVSHYAVLKQNPELRFPADMYLEGRDQHRGWFQSSLLTSYMLYDVACMKTIVTHGFTVDDKGRKMSKSLGNVVAPQEMIDKLGTDGLRLWAASVDCSGGDVVVSPAVMTNVQEVHRKIRNTCRFLLSNLYDFDIAADAIPVDTLRMLDYYAVRELLELNSTLVDRYRAYDIAAVFHGLSAYCAVNLSSFYLDIVKDRLYVEKSNGLLRRSAQTTCYYILDTIVRLMAPILSFTAEQVTDQYQKNKTNSIHEQLFAVTPAADAERVLFATALQRERAGILSVLEYNAALEEQFDKEVWDFVKLMRTALLKVLEEKREQGLVKHSLEAQIRWYLDEQSPYMPHLKALKKVLETRGEQLDSFFKELIIVSGATQMKSREGLQEITGVKGLYGLADHADGVKCPRCWQWEITADSDGLCARCYAIVR